MNNSKKKSYAIVFGIFAREDINDYYGNVEIPAGTMISTSGIGISAHARKLS